MQRQKLTLYSTKSTVYWLFSTLSYNCCFRYLSACQGFYTTDLQNRSKKVFLLNIARSDIVTSFSSKPVLFIAVYIFYSILMIHQTNWEERHRCTHTIVLSNQPSQQLLNPTKTLQPYKNNNNKSQIPIMQDFLTESNIFLFLDLQDIDYKSNITQV